MRARFTVEAVNPKPRKAAAIVRFSVQLLGDAEQPLLDGHHTYLIASRCDVVAPGGREVGGDLPTYRETLDTFRSA